MNIIYLKVTPNLRCINSIFYFKGDLFPNHLDLGFFLFYSGLFVGSGGYEAGFLFPRAPAKGSS